MPHGTLRPRSIKPQDSNAHVLGRRADDLSLHRDSVAVATALFVQPGHPVAGREGRHQCSPSSVVDDIEHPQRRPLCHVDEELEDHVLLHLHAVVIAVAAAETPGVLPLLLTAAATASVEQQMRMTAPQPPLMTTWLPWAR